jgi:peptidoglycan/xylan/chitin deacetylase (PgdA/CDA1 family)
MYHGVISGSAAVPKDRETGAELYDVLLENFKAQMDFLKTQKFTPVVFGHLELPQQTKPVVITFDDGELNNFQYALPVLKDFGWKAYFFIIVNRIGQQGYMGWDHLKQMLKAGMVIGSHGLSHAILTRLSDTDMEEELRVSKNNLETNLGTTIDTISIPRGFCNDKIIKTAYRLGFKTVFISVSEGKMPAGCFSRTAVKSDWSLKRFGMAINGRTPALECLGDLTKRMSKKILGEDGYNSVRDAVIKRLP